MKKKAIAIITTILLSISIFMDTPFAEAHGPDNIVYTPYGTCTSEFYYDSANSTHNITLGGVTIPQVGPVNLLRYTFTHPYTGTFDLDITISGVLSNRWELMTSNCYLVSVVDETTLRFAVNNATYCEIAIMPQYYNNRLVLWLENQNLTPVDDTVTAVNDILSHVTYMDGQIQQIHADTTMIKNLIISMSGYTSDSSDNIATDMDTLIGIMSTLSTLGQLENVPVESTNAYLLFRSLGNIVVYDRDKFPYYNVTSNLHQSIRSYLYKDKVYYLSLRIYNPDNRNLFGCIHVYNNGGTEITTERVYHDYISNYSTVTISITPPVGDYYYVDFNSFIIGKSITPFYFGENVGLSEEMYNITHIPNLTHGLLQGIIDAVRNMALNVTNLTVNATGITYTTNQTQVDNSITTYNTNIDQVFNIENNISDDFDTYNQQFDPANELNTFLPTTQNASSFMSNIVGNLYNYKIIKYPVILTLVGIVLISILG